MVTGEGNLKHYLLFSKLKVILLIYNLGSVFTKWKVLWGKFVILYMKYMRRRPKTYISFDEIQAFGRVKSNYSYVKRAHGHKIEDIHSVEFFPTFLENGHIFNRRLLHSISTCALLLRERFKNSMFYS